MALHASITDRPTFATASMASQTYTGDSYLAGNFQAMGVSTPSYTEEYLRKTQQRVWLGGAQSQPYEPSSQSETVTKPKEKIVADNKYVCRLVRVIVVDPHESVPMDSRVLFMGDEKMTDSTDEELFFEIAAELNAKLKAHNDKRVTWTEKKNVAEPEKAKKLEVARLRDLRMTVVNIATF